MQIFNNEDGIVLIACIFIMCILTLTGLAATRTSNTEAMIVRNEGLMAIEFYNAEAAIIDARENFQRWMTDAFLTTDLLAAYDSFVINDENGNPAATVEVRNIVDTDETPDLDAVLTDPANDLPIQPNVASPPEGSGYSMKYFIVRNYGITATSTSGNTVLQAGVWKVFNKQ